jgi:hypothetical protein
MIALLQIERKGGNFPTYTWGAEPFTAKCQNCGNVAQYEKSQVVIFSKSEPLQNLRPHPSFLQR